MSLLISCIGVDPGGKVVGISLLDYIDARLAGHTVLQVDAASAVGVLECILIRGYSDPEVVMKRFAQVEAFVTGQSAGTKGQPADVTRQGVFAFTELLQMWGYHVERRKSADVKPWATNKRLEAAGIWQPDGMRHGNDASRHAIYTAKHDAYRPDPLR